MLTISNNPTRKGLSVFRPNIIYSTASGVELTMDMLIPNEPILTLLAIQLLYLFREVHGIFLIRPTKFLN